jgi:hypothetical protein
METLILLVLVIGVPLGLLFGLVYVLGNIRDQFWARRKARTALVASRPPRSRYAVFKPDQLPK